MSDIINTINEPIYINVEAGPPGTGGVGIEVMANYAALRSLTTTSEVVLVSDWTYTGPDGNTYTTIGGLFEWTGNALLENGGTLIKGWKRVWDGINAKPEWWECGGFDVRGRNYTNKNAMSDLSLVPQQYVFHDGIYNDRDRIQSAIFLGSATKDIVVQYEPRDYIIDMVLSNYSRFNDGFNIGGGHEFNFATIKRANTTATTLTANMSASATSIQVANASTYRVGMNLTVFSPSSPHGGLGYDEAALLTIIGISGNTINVINGSPSKSFNSGAIVLPEITLFDNRIYGGDIKYSNATFEGNKMNGGGQRYPKDWRLNYGIAAGTGVHSATFDNIIFKDNPGENVTAAAGVMTNCKGYNLDGSFFHYSMNENRYNLGLMTGFVIDKCYIDGVCLATDAVSDHCEGAITPSLKTEFVKITNCTFKNGSESVFAIDAVQLDAKVNYIVSNNTFINFKNISLSPIIGSVNIDERKDVVMITNNHFYNCGDYVIGARPHQTNIYKGKSFDQFVISGNIFIGSRFYFENLTNVIFSNNQILFRDELNSTYPDWGLVDIDANPERSAIVFYRCAKIVFDNNIIENQYTEHLKLQAGIVFPAKNFTPMKDSIGNELNYYYEQGVSITNNKILGFQNGILTALSVLDNITSLAGAINKSVLAWEIKNNMIILSKATPLIAGSASYKKCGISAVIGCIVEGNTIWQQRDDEHQTGIWALNHEPWPATTSSLVGVTVKNNWIYGVNAGSDITMDVFGNGWGRNGICLYNVTKRAIEGTNSSRNYLLGNILINNTTLPSLATPEIPTFQTFEWNKNNY